MYEVTVTYRVLVDTLSREQAKALAIAEPPPATARLTAVRREVIRERSGSTVDAMAAYAR